ncbi:MAG: hypothetical protein ACTSXE_02615 [Candidatus Thorarchaeota archaeon]
MSIKVKIGLSVVNGYTTIAEKAVTVEIDDISNPDDLLDVIKLLNSNAQNKGIFNVTHTNAIEIYLDMERHRIKEEAAKQAKLDSSQGKATWKLESELTAAQMAEKQARCQLDGVLKMNDPNYVPAQDRNDPQNL